MVKTLTFFTSSSPIELSAQLQISLVWYEQMGSAELVTANETVVLRRTATASAIIALRGSATEIEIFIEEVTIGIDEEKSQWSGIGIGMDVATTIEGDTRVQVEMSGKEAINPLVDERA